MTGFRIEGCYGEVAVEEIWKIWRNFELFMQARISSGDSGARRAELRAVNFPRLHVLSLRQQYQDSDIFCGASVLTIFGYILPSSVHPAASIRLELGIRFSTLISFLLCRQHV